MSIIEREKNNWQMKASLQNKFMTNNKNDPTQQHKTQNK